MDLRKISFLLIAAANLVSAGFVLGGERFAAFGVYFKGWVKSVRAQELLGWNHGTVRVGREKCRMFTKEKSSSSIPSSFGSFPSGKGVSQHLHQPFNKGLVDRKSVV